MESKEILEKFNTEFAEINAQGGLQLALRWSGEQLAQAGERLRKANDADRQARGAELLVIAGAHIATLSEAQLDPDAFATQAMAVLTVIMERVDPEKMASLYLGCLQMLCIMGARWLYGVKGDADIMQGMTIMSEVYGLFLATAHNFMPRFGASDDMKKFYDHLRHITADNAEEIRLFRGMPLQPTMAADVLADILARLRALGVELY